MKNRKYRKLTPEEERRGVFASFTMICVPETEDRGPVTLLDPEEWHPKTRIKRLSEWKES